MALKQIRVVDLVEEREKKEMEKLESQADVFEVVAMLYEEVEGVRTEVIELKTKVEVLEGGVK